MFEFCRWDVSWHGGVSVEIGAKGGTGSAAITGTRVGCREIGLGKCVSNVT